MSKPTVGLALGGGGARGYSFIHALKAFDDLGLRPSAVAGTSIGSVIGALYCSGLSAVEVETFIRDRIRNRVRLAADLFRVKPENARKFLHNGGFRVGELNIERVLKAILPKAFPKSFEELSIPLQVIATDYYRQCDRVFDQGLLVPALAASSAIPAIFQPVIVEGDVFVDGGISNPTPFDKLKDKVDIIVAIDITGLPKGQPGRRPRKVNVIISTGHIMQQSITRAKAEYYKPDILIRPDLPGVRIYDVMKFQKILNDSVGLYDVLTEKLSDVIR